MMITAQKDEDEREGVEWINPNAMTVGFNISADGHNSLISRWQTERSTRSSSMFVGVGQLLV